MSNIFFLIIIWIISVKSFTHAREYDDFSIYNNDSFYESDVYKDATSKTPDFIQRYNYPAEVHDAVTVDGYILELHRIPNPGKIPVLLQHGLGSTSADFILNGPKLGLAFNLYDEGYDIWLGNQRGNRYSKRHIKFTRNNSKYWDFTLTEYGKYDVKAAIDYVIKTTKFEKIHYVGFSQGGAVIFILCDDKPEYSDKLIGIQGIAPAVYVQHLSSQLTKFLMNLYITNMAVFQTIGTGLFPNFVDLGLAPVLFGLCKDGSSMQKICNYILELTVGFNEMETNKTKLPIILGHYPSGVSVKVLYHFSQFALTGEFKKYDYGIKGNLKAYGQKKPPFYDIRKTKAKFTIYHSSNDALVVNKDIERLYKELAAPYKKVLYDDYNFNHFHFIAGFQSAEFNRKHIIPTMKELDKNNK